MVRLYCFLIGYFIGVISFAYIIGKIKGVNIQQKGSGNLGATNTMRVLGKKSGIIVMLLDFMKIVTAILLVNFLFGAEFHNEIFLLHTYTLAGGILGHDFPFYLKFKGGKGCACLGGYLIFFHPFLAIFLAIAFFLILHITHYMSVCTMSLYAFFGAIVIICGHNGMLGLEHGQLIEVYLIYILLFVITIIKHTSNIKRIIKKEENKTYLLKKSNKE